MSEALNILEFTARMILAVIKPAPLQLFWAILAVIVAPSGSCIRAGTRHRRTFLMPAGLTMVITFMPSVVPAGAFSSVIPMRHVAMIPTVFSGAQLLILSLLFPNHALLLESVIPLVCAFPLAKLSFPALQLALLGTFPITVGICDKPG